MRTQMPVAFSPLLKVKARYKGFFGGRGSAKSHSFAESLVIRASQEPVRVLCGREIQRSIKESVKKLLDDKIVKLGLAHAFTSTTNQISSSTGAWFGFEGLRNNIDTIRSMEGIDIFWNEEANTTSLNSLNTVIPTIRKEGSELWFSWNPRFKTDPVDVMFRGEHVIDGDLPMAGYDEWMISRRVNFDSNKWFPEVLRAEMERDKRRDPDRYAHIWLGEYAKHTASRVFNNWRIGTMDVPLNQRPYYGADWGFVDPTVLVRCYVFEAQRVLYIDAEVYQSNCPIDKTPALFDTLDGGAARKWPMKADSSRPETINYLANHGYPQISGARKGPKSVEEGVEFLKNYDIVIHPNCPRVIDEFSLYSYEVDKLTEAVLPKLADEHNHVIDAVRYAVEDLRRESKIIIPIILTAPRVYVGDNPERGIPT